jgi:hypothetical protein
MEDEKKTKRKKEKYPGLKKNLYSRIKQEYFDLDYVDDLMKPGNEEAAIFMDNFMTGFLGANTKDNPIFPEWEDKKKCWDANNARNRDVYNVKKVTGELTDIAIMEEPEICDEDSLIDYIDEGKEIDKI